MFRKTLLGTLVVGAVAATAVVVVKVLESQKETKNEKKEDNEVHFIEITDGDEEEEPEPQEEPTVEPKEEPETSFITIENQEEVSNEEEPEEEKDDLLIQSFPQDPQELEEVDESVREIQELYPFLTVDFIQKVLDKNEEFMVQYPEDTLVCVTHKVTFTELKTLLEFELIMTEATYVCTQIDRETIEVSKRYFSEDGAVISDILNVANQVNALHGTYVGYTLD